MKRLYKDGQVLTFKPGNGKMPDKKGIAEIISKMDEKKKIPDSKETKPEPKVKKPREPRVKKPKELGPFKVSKDKGKPKISSTLPGSESVPKVVTDDTLLDPLEQLSGDWGFPGKAFDSASETNQIKPDEIPVQPSIEPDIDTFLSESWGDSIPLKEGSETERDPSEIQPSYPRPRTSDDLPADTPEPDKARTHVIPKTPYEIWKDARGKKKKKQKAPEYVARLAAAPENRDSHKTKVRKKKKKSKEGIPRREKFVLAGFALPPVLISIISMLHLIRFFDIANSAAMAITLAISFELGSIAALAGLAVLGKIKKATLWVIFFVVAGVEVIGNVYHAFTEFEPSLKTKACELFGMIDNVMAERILAAFIGGILPILALVFIKCIVEYLKVPE